MVKISNGVSRNVNLEFLHASTTVIASLHHHLITSARSTLRSTSSLTQQPQ
jgi:hypothetical protein